ncbi:energy transducer TonB [Roseomonas sp. GC11]|uniref:energy transducer TonB family protein n=1 Tax=Roseomonas sp. GC11 TaxID=2950546 RepID=UPI00210BF0E6|nr:energy transducer TonB [Roseomonas sp. GC11]MCQ4160513.1 energy transducer TonB [Roseomonas sp. GC11]
MSGWSAPASRSARLLVGALWPGAGLVVLMAHLGAVAWLMREAAVTLPDAAPPMAIAIELAEVAEARHVARNEITPDREDATAAAVQAQLPPPEDAAENSVAEETPRLTAPVALPPPAKPRPPPRQEAARRSPRSQPEPQPRARPPMPDQADPPQPGAQAAVAAQAQVQQASRDAGRQSASGVSAAGVVSWQARLIAHLERHKRYPAGARARREQGMAYLSFTIDEEGRVLSASLQRSSGFVELDEEVLAMIRRAARVPPPPAGLPLTITTPVIFLLR